MKKALSLILAICMLLALAGCGGKEPTTKDGQDQNATATATPTPVSQNTDNTDKAENTENTEPADTEPEKDPVGKRESAKDALDAMLKDPVNQMMILQDSGDEASEGYLAEEDLCRKMLDGMTYKITNAEENGDTAVVTADITNADAAEIIPEYFTQMFAFALGQAFSEEPMSDEELEAYCIELLAGFYDQPDLKTVTTTVDVSMNYADGKWNIENEEELGDALLGGFISAFDDLDEFGEFGGEDYSESPFNVDYALSDYTLAENESCLIKITDIAFDTDWNEIDIQLYCENNSDIPLDFTTDSVIACGYSVSNFWYEDVAAGKKVNSTLSLNASDLAQAGITSLDELILNIHVTNGNDWLEAPILLDSFTIYPTGLDADSVVYPARRTTANEQLMVDNEYCTMIILEVDTEGYWGPELICYVENKTEEPIYISMEDVSVNNYMMEPYWGVSLPAGAKGYSSVSFDSDDLEANGITEMEHVEFMLYAHSDESWDDYFDTYCVYEP